jgi:hypothetical protein
MRRRRRRAHAPAYPPPPQITAAKLASLHPSASPALEAALLPGTWLRECVTPLLRCRIAAGAPGGCEREERQLFDLARARRRAQLPSLVKLLEGPDIARPGADALVYGAALVTLCAALSAVITVKTAAAGFLMMVRGMGVGGSRV